MDGSSIRPMDHGNLKDQLQDFEAASRTLGDFKNDRETSDKES
jgi:hypothetical protein